MPVASPSKPPKLLVTENEVSLKSDAAKKQNIIADNIQPKVIARDSNVGGATSHIYNPQNLKDSVVSTNMAISAQERKSIQAKLEESKTVVGADKPIFKTQEGANLNNRRGI